MATYILDAIKPTFEKGQYLHVGWKRFFFKFTLVDIFFSLPQQWEIFDCFWIYVANVFCWEEIRRTILSKNTQPYRGAYFHESKGVQNISAFIFCFIICGKLLQYSVSCSGGKIALVAHSTLIFCGSRGPRTRCIM